MTTLLKRLLAWLGALGAPVVLLSATLPRDRRDALLKAYAEGGGWPTPADSPEARYPRLAWTTPASTGACSVETSAQSTRSVAIEWVDGHIPEDESAFALGERLIAALAQGGCAAVVCNTVRRAQQVYLALKPYFSRIADDGEPELDLLHARYLFEQRDTREARVLRRFGKAAKLGGSKGLRRPHRAVLVATQIIEQSLDLDFDLMVTDPAPADLVLQRAGRLHRHDRSGQRPPDLAAPRLWITSPDTGTGLPLFAPGTEAVYDRHVLLRSWLALRERATIAIPADVEELVEAVYDGRLCPADLGEPLRTAWEDTRRAHDIAVAAEAREAAFRFIRRPGYDGPLDKLAGEPREEDAPELHPEHQALTRLIEPAVPVVFLYGTPECPAFRVDGSDALNVTRSPNVETTRRLLRRSVTVSDRRVVFSLLRQAPPPGWLKSPLLRTHRLLTLGTDGEATCGRLRLQLDEELGLVIAGPGGQGGSPA